MRIQSAGTLHEQKLHANSAQKNIYCVSSPKKSFTLNHLLKFLFTIKT